MAPLLLFPARLVHSVDANRSAEQRISVSFNMMFRTYAEIMSKPMW
jgi:ectoine hydroxylase-related dioxygenase (phytanoyl-CoA dioxygenase family)